MVALCTYVIYGISSGLVQDRQKNFCYTDVITCNACIARGKLKGKATFFFVDNLPLKIPKTLVNICGKPATNV